MFWDNLGLKSKGGQTGWILAIILVFAFSARLALGLHRGADQFIEGGYEIIYRIASAVVAGDYSTISVRSPAYPALLALVLKLGGGFVSIAVMQSAIGAGTALFAFLVGRELFAPRCGLIAASFVAIYPYYVNHDTALQETSLVALLSTASVYLLLRARTKGGLGLWLVTGLILSVNVLTRTTMLPFALCGVVWILAVGEGPVAKNLLRAGVIALAFSIPVGGWMARNQVVLGRPILSTEAGYQFWLAHNPYTFSRYPTQSIDRSRDVAVRAFTPEERAQLRSLKGEPLAVSDWYEQKGMAYVRAHPLATLVGAVRKVTTGYSLIFSPWGGWGQEAIYLLSYGPILTLGLLGVWLTRRDWRVHAIVYVQFAGFTAVTADYWAHTSHRVYLDVLLMIYAAYVVHRAVDRTGTVASLLGDARDRMTGMGGSIKSPTV